MDITTTKTQVNNVFDAEIVTALSPREISFSDAYGEPTIDSGGTITYQKSGAHTFTVPGGQRGIRTGIPFEYQLSANIDEDAQLKVDAWAATIIQRLTDAKEALMANDPPNTPNVAVVSV